MTEIAHHFVTFRSSGSHSIQHDVQGSSVSSKSWKMQTMAPKHQPMFSEKNKKPPPQPPKPRHPPPHWHHLQPQRNTFSEKNSGCLVHVLPPASSLANVSRCCLGKHGFIAGDPPLFTFGESFFSASMFASLEPPCFQGWILNYQFMLLTKMNVRGYLDVPLYQSTLWEITIYALYIVGMAARNPWGKNPIHVGIPRHAWKSDKAWTFSAKKMLGTSVFSMETKQK